MRSLLAGFRFTSALVAVGLATLAGAVSVARAQDSSIQGGDLRAPSPVIVNWDRPGYFQVGAGPSFASGLGTDDALFDVNVAYNYNLSNSFTAKAISDFNFGGSDTASRLISLGVGIDAYFSELETTAGFPYFGIDIGYGFVRDERQQNDDAFMVGASTGFKFAVEAVNLDLNVHYSFLTSQLNGVSPTVLGVRLATNF